ncbi:hypothetical protein ZIOFF_017634 [Zingiber officinale]|uniref:Carbonic anhydrase n=1 Tax=Zingiber officinale TaxID=94328 RepID=A0A8J5HNY9_ZINOF|nr:hypothetical protein ZIOFF_017634 [Zingiber officinale]
MATHRIEFFAVSALLLFLQSPLASSQEVEQRFAIDGCEFADHEDEFSYERGSEIGPNHWGEIHEEWAACGHGRLQSPIDLTDSRLQWEEDAGNLQIDGKDYDLKQLHWHSPSEHTINGRRFSLELHMVHQSADNSTAVVGILYTIGRHDPFLSNIERQIQMIADKHEAEEAVGMVDPRHIRRGSRKYYRYMGSLTTPPCTEGVVWSIVKKVRTVTREQVDLLRQAVHDVSNTRNNSFC